MTPVELGSYIPVALWLAALLAIFTLKKFERKWAWLILACAYLELRGYLPDGQVTGLPVGAVVVLLFAIFKPAPLQAPSRPRPWDEPLGSSDEMSENLRRTGKVDEALFRNFAERLAYDSASTVGWLERQFDVLLRRVQSGERLYLYQPNGLPELVASTAEEFRSWAETYFPGARVG